MSSALTSCPNDSRWSSGIDPSTGRIVFSVKANDISSPENMGAKFVNLAGGGGACDGYTIQGIMCYKPAGGEVSEAFTSGSGASVGNNLYLAVRENGMRFDFSFDPSVEGEVSSTGKTTIVAKNEGKFKGLTSGFKGSCVQMMVMRKKGIAPRSVPKVDGAAPPSAAAPPKAAPTATDVASSSATAGGGGGSGGLPYAAQIPGSQWFSGRNPQTGRLVFGVDFGSSSPSSDQNVQAKFVNLIGDGCDGYCLQGILCFKPSGGAVQDSFNNSISSAPGNAGQNLDLTVKNDGTLFEFSFDPSEMGEPTSSGKMMTVARNGDGKFKGLGKTAFKGSCVQMLVLRKKTVDPAPKSSVTATTVSANAAATTSAGGASAPPPSSSAAAQPATSSSFADDGDDDDGSYLTTTSSMDWKSGKHPHSGYLVFSIDFSHNADTDQNVQTKWVKLSGEAEGYMLNGMMVYKPKGGEILPSFSSTVGAPGAQVGNNLYLKVRNGGTRFDFSFDPSVEGEVSSTGKTTIVAKNEGKFKGLTSGFKGSCVQMMVMRTEPKKVPAAVKRNREDEQ